MTWKQRTMIVMLSIPAIIVMILVYDAFAVHFGGTEASISSIMINSAYQMPFMVFSIGLFIGIISSHLFWRMRPNKDTIASGIDKL